LQNVIPGQYTVQAQIQEARPPGPIVDTAGQPAFSFAKETRCSKLERGLKARDYILDRRLIRSCEKTLRMQAVPFRCESAAVSI